MGHYASSAAEARALDLSQRGSAAVGAGAAGLSHPASTVAIPRNNLELLRFRSSRSQYAPGRFSQMSVHD